MGRVLPALCREVSRLMAHPTQSALTRSQIMALTTRADLLEEEAATIRRRRISWRGRLRELGSYGTTGGSAADRRAIVEALAALEGS